MIFISQTRYPYPISFVPSWFYYFVRGLIFLVILLTPPVIPSVSRDLIRYQYEDPSTSFTNVHFAQDDRGGSR